jgi:hypothetical protein
VQIGLATSHDGAERILVEVEVLLKLAAGGFELFELLLPGPELPGPRFGARATLSDCALECRLSSWAAAPRLIRRSIASVTPGIPESA